MAGDKTKGNPHKRPKVGTSFGLTKNLGDYNSLRIDVWYEDYVKPDETPEETAERVWDMVDSEVAKRLQEVNETMGG